MTSPGVVAALNLDQLGTFTRRRALSMMPRDARLAELLHTFEITGNRYIAKSLPEALKSTNTAEGSTASEIADVAAAKASWTAAEKALAAYQAGDFTDHKPPATTNAAPT